jgi:hypothetical protein
VWKTLGKRPLVTQRIGTKDNIKTDLSKMGRDDGRWMKLAQDRVQWQALVLAVLYLGVLIPQC